MSGKRKISDVFISHYKRDEEHLHRFKALMKRNGVAVRNSSVDSSKLNNANNPDYIKSMLRKRIRWAETFFVLIGPKTHTREWVGWEIDQAYRQGKRIVGVYINGAKESDVPIELDDYGDALVGWDFRNIKRAMNGAAIWVAPNGNSRISPFATSRTNC